MHLTRIIGLVPAFILLGGLFAGGCDGCNGTIDPGGEPRITFLFPENGDTIASTDDYNPSEEGIQINVRVSAEYVGDGAAIILTNDLTTDSQGVPRPTNGTIANDRVTFSAYTVPEGQVTLRAALEGVDLDESCTLKRDNCAEITIQVAENVCVFNNPHDGDVLDTEPPAYVSADPFDPFEIDVELDCRGVPENDYVALVVGLGRSLVAQADAGGHVVFTEVPLAEGANKLSATPGTDAHGAGGTGATVSATVTVNTGRCLVDVSPADGSILLQADDRQVVEPNDGMQAIIDVATDCAATSTVRVFFADPAGSGDFVQVNTAGPDPEISSHPLGSRFRFDALTVPESVTAGAYDVLGVAEVEEPGGGRKGVSLIVAYWVDSTLPELAVYSPSDNACVADRDDTADGIQIVAAGTVNSADEAEIWVRLVEVDPPACATDAECADVTMVTQQLCRAELCRWVGTVTPGNGAYSIDGIEVPFGVVELEYLAADLAGNIGDPEFATFTSYGAAPTITITSPLDGTTVCGSQDADPGTTGLQYDVILSLTDVLAGSAGNVSVGAGAGFPFTPNPGGSVVSVRVTLQNGPRTITARVNNNTCGIFSQDAVSVIASSSATGSPIDLTATAYEGGTGLAEPIPDGTITTVATIDLDIGTGVAAVARNVNVAFTDQVTAGACTGSQTQPEITAQVAVGESGVVLSPSIMLTDGTNCMTITASDYCTPAGVTMTYVVVQRTSTSIPQIDTPNPPLPWSDANDTAGDLTDGFQQTLVVSLAPPADVNGVLNLRIAGTPPTSIASLPVVAPASSVPFSNITLQPGTYAIEAVFIDAYGLSATSAPLTMIINLSGPHILITKPEAGGFYNNANFEVVVHSQASGTDPTDCVMLVDGNPSVNFTWPAGESTATVDASLPEGAHTIRVECIDAGAVLGFQTVTNVTIDDSGPAAPAYVDEPAGTPGQIIFTDGAWVNGNVVFTGGGTIHPVTARVDGTIESLHGFRLELSATAPGVSGPVVSSYARCLWVGTAGPLDPTCVSTVITSGVLADVTFPSVNFGSASEGAISFALTLLDRARNPSAVVAVGLQKDTIAPVIVQTRPDPALITLNRDHDDNLSTAEIDTQFLFNVTGGVEGADCDTDEEHCLGLTVTPPPGEPGPDYRTIPVGGMNVQFWPQAFPNDTLNGYEVYAETTDAAGNVGTATDHFFVDSVEPRVEWAWPAAAGNLNMTFNRTFSVTAAGFQVDSKVVLCSTQLPTGIVPLPAGSCDPLAQLGCPCRWGSNEQLGGPDMGHVIAASFLQGTVMESSAAMYNVSLAQGVQVMHFEARETDTDPDLFSPFRTFTVDTLPPVVTTFTLTQNIVGNDGTNVRLGGPEGTTVGSYLRTEVFVQVTGSAAGQLVRVNNGTTWVQMGTPVLDASQQATFTIQLPEGLGQTLRVDVKDPAGNPSNGTPVIVVGVDVTVPTVSIPIVSTVFNSLTHTPVDGGTPGDHSDDYIEVPVTATISDNNLQGAQLVLAGYDGNTCATMAGLSQSYTASLGDGSHQFAAVPLFAGHNYLKATLTDVFGNQGSTLSAGLCTSYDADFYGPVVAIEMWDGTSSGDGAEPVSCGATEGTACYADTLTPVGGRVQLDRTGGAPGDWGDTYCSQVAIASGECATDGSAGQEGSDLRIVLTECSNSHSDFEDCAVWQPTVRIRATLPGGTFGPVSQGTFTTNGDIPPAPGDPVSLLTLAPAYAFDPALIWQVRLSATDKNGNISVSDSIFVKINEGGVAPDVVVRDASTLPDPGPKNLGDTDINGDLFLGHGYSNSAQIDAFQVDLDVALTSNIPSLIPDRVDLTCSPMACRPGNFTISESGISGAYPSFTAEVLGVDLQPSAPDAVQETTIIFTVYCGGLVCGQREYTGVFADPAPPTYQFDRCSLCALGVRYGGDVPGACTGCAAHNALDTADITATDVVWNHSGDQVQSSASTFTITTTPLTLLVKGLDSGRTITLDSSQTGRISGNTRTGVTGCTSTATACRVDFTGLELDTLEANADRHLLTVRFTDKAGNRAIPDPDIDRCAGADCDYMDEAISALVDTLRPEGVATTVCIGESTDPYDSDPPSAMEDAACTAYCPSAATCGTYGDVTTCTNNGCYWDTTPVVDVCVRACSRTKGRAVLRWLAPHDDGAGDTGTAALDHYEILVAARGIPYGASPALTTCDDLEPGDEVEQTFISSITPGAPGSEVIEMIDGLYPHRSYCFAVVGVDDVGNQAAILPGDQTERVMPLVTDVPGLAGGPEIVTFDPLSPNDDDSAGVFYGPGSGVGSQVFNIGDLDRDGREDFAVTAKSAARLDLFLSNGPNLTTPRSLDTPLSINAPTTDGTTPDTTFGYSVAHGDFDADGFTDLAVCSNGANNWGGALYLYYGKAGIGIDVTNTNSDPDLPDVTPDVALVAPAGSYFCLTVELADVDGRPGDDLVISPWSMWYVYGYWGGGRNRFPSAKTTASFSSYSSGWNPETPGVAPGAPQYPDFTLQGASGYAAWFAVGTATPDLDGDGIRDVVASDPWVGHGEPANSSCNSDGAGEVYVYRGGTSLAGLIPAPDTAPTQLMHLLRYKCTSAYFGLVLARIPAPRADNQTPDTADWLYARAGINVGILFKGTDVGNAGIIPRDPAVLDEPDPRIYPDGGAATYWLLNRQLWNGSTQSRFGGSMTVLGELDGFKGIDIAFAPGVDYSNAIFLYSYSEASEGQGGVGFMRSAILRGAALVCPGSPLDARCAYGSSLAGVDNYAGSGIQLVVGTYSPSATNGMIHLYR